MHWIMHPAISGASQNRGRSRQTDSKSFAITGRSLLSSKFVKWTDIDHGLLLLWTGHFFFDLGFLLQMLVCRHVVRKAVEHGGHRAHVAGRLHLPLPRLGRGERFSLFWPPGKRAAGFLRHAGGG